MKKIKMRNKGQLVEVLPSEVQSMKNRGYEEVKPKAKRNEKKEDLNNG